MIHPLLLVLTALGLLYGLGVALLIIGLFNIKAGRTMSRPFVSVVIAARDEEKTIGRCLAALSDQDYPASRYEVIVVDDRSSDGTGGVLAAWSGRMKNLRWLQVGTEPSPLTGKKRALDLGIRGSRGEIILTTDADCLPKPTWIGAMVRAFEPAVGLVAGYASTEEPGERTSLLRQLRSLERMAVAGVAAGSIGLGRGLTAVGQNLAYRKSVYVEVGGFSKIGNLRSGDDDLFIQLVSRSTSWEMRYATARETHVRTTAPTGLARNIQQDRRRASKGLHYQPWLVACLIGLYCFYGLLFCLLCLSPVYWAQLRLAWAVFGLKMVLDGILIYRICSLLGRRDLLPLFPAGEVLHLPYVLLFGAWGTLGTYRWKE